MKTAPNLTYQDIEIGFLLASPTNPRKTFREIEDLAASIKRHGLIHALTVRPILPENYKNFEALKKAKIKDGVQYYEVVSGERRLRALQQLAQKSDEQIFPVCCAVRFLSQDEVIDIQITENLQRDDLPPMDEAEALHSLHHIGGMSVRELALRLGKSETYILTRLQLMKLIPKIRKSLAAGELGLSLAVELARLNEPGQRQVFKWSKDLTTDNGDAVEFFKPVKEVKAYIKNTVFQLLADAPFNVKDPKLVAKAGACAVCPKNTSCASVLFPDIDNARCTDAVCYQEKIDAHQLQEFKAYNKKASKVNQPPIYLSLNWNSSGEHAKLKSFYGIEDLATRNSYFYGEQATTIKEKGHQPFIAFVVDAPSWSVADLEMVGTTIEVFPNDATFQAVLYNREPDVDNFELQVAEMDPAAREQYLKDTRKRLEQERQERIQNAKRNLVYEALEEKADIKQNTPALSEMQYMVYICLTNYDLLDNPEKVVLQYKDLYQDFQPRETLKEWTADYEKLKDPDLVLPTYLEEKRKALLAQDEDLENQLEYPDHEEMLVHLCQKLTKIQCWKIVRTAFYSNAAQLVDKKEFELAEKLAIDNGIDIDKLATAAGRKHPKKAIENEIAEILGVFQRIPPPDPSAVSEDEQE